MEETGVELMTQRLAKKVVPSPRRTRVGKVMGMADKIGEQS